jgi:hypothetical protein
MGLFCANFHFRTDDDKALTTALKRRKVTAHRIVPAKKGWTTLYEEVASQQDEERIRELAGGLSKDLKVPAVAFMVHDSDIACYWLYDNGQLLDEYNSCPDYFEGGDEPSGPSGGQPDVFLRYCRPGTRTEDLAAILAEDVVFAEGIVEKLADALGIDAERALTDFNDGGGPDGDGDGDEDEDDDGEGPSGGSNAEKVRALLAGRLGQMFGGKSETPADPQVAALVDAAVRGDVPAIDRLVGEGVAIDEQALAPLAGNEASGLGLVMPGGMPKVAMTPLLAAVAHKQRAAVERLLHHGADVNLVHPLFGPPVHTATGAGEAAMLELLIDRGADVNARNPRGQTPLQQLAASRAIQNQLAQAQAMVRSMGVKVPNVLEQMSKTTLPIEGWDACEQVLKAHGAL